MALPPLKNVARELPSGLEGIRQGERQPDREGGKASGKQRNAGKQATIKTPRYEVADAPVAGEQSNPPPAGMLSTGFDSPNTERATTARLHGTMTPSLGKAEPVHGEKAHKPERMPGWRHPDGVSFGKPWQTTPPEDLKVCIVWRNQPRRLTMTAWPDEDDGR